MNLQNAHINAILEHKKRILELLSHVELKHEDAPLLTASPEQAYMFEYCREGEGDIVFNMPVSYLVHGSLCHKSLEAALKFLVSRHEAFRTNFVLLDDVIYQTVKQSADFKLELHDISDKNTDISILVDSLSKESFDLEKDVLFKIKLFKLNNDKHLLFFLFHHIVFDGWSMGVFFDDFTRAYKNLVGNVDVAHGFLPIEISAADYYRWKDDLYKNGFYENELTYWKTKLAFPHTNLVFPFADKRPAVETHTGGRFFFTLADDKVKKVFDFCDENKITVHCFLMAAYFLTLKKLTVSNDIIVGTMVTGRSVSSLAGVIGNFYDTVVVRVNVDDNNDFLDVLSKVVIDYYEGYVNQEFPATLLEDHVDFVEDPSRNPIFQTFFINQNVNKKDLILENCVLENIKYIRNTSEIDIVLSYFNLNNTLKFKFQYNIDIFKESDVELIVATYKLVIDDFFNKLASESDFSHRKLSNNIAV